MDGHERICCFSQTLYLLGVLGVLAVPLMGRPWPTNRPQVFDSVSVMREGRGIQPPRRQERQGGEKRHGWIGHEQYGWARAHLLLSPDSLSSWRPWRLGGSPRRLGGSSLASAIVVGAFFGFTVSAKQGSCGNQFRCSCIPPSHSPSAPLREFSPSGAAVPSAMPQWAFRTDSREFGVVSHPDLGESSGFDSTERCRGIAR